MEVLKGITDGFVYETVFGAPRAHLAGTNVLVLKEEPDSSLIQDAANLDQAQYARDAIVQARSGAGFLNLTTRAVSATSRARLRRILCQAGIPNQDFDRDDCLFAVCTEVSFHHDLPLAGIFGAWCLSGPTRDLVFPYLGVRVPFVPGTLVIFDAVQPHGLIRPGESEFTAQANGTADLTVFVSLLLGENDVRTNSLVGRQDFDAAKHANHPRLARGQAANPRCGTLSLSNI